MSAHLPRLLAIAALAAVAGHASAAITIYGQDNFHGKRVTLTGVAPDFRAFRFNDRAASVIVDRGPWEVCQDVGFQSRCVVLLPGRYPNLNAVGLNERLSSARPAPPPPPPVATGSVVFYEDAGFHGRSIGVTSAVNDFGNRGFQNQTSSVIVFDGRWEACDHAGFRGRCVVLRPGRYPDLAAMGLNDRLTSVRRLRPQDRVEEARYAPMPLPAYDWRPRPAETLQMVRVDTVHAVYGTPQQRCWTEQAAQPDTSRTTGAVIGGVIGGILGHQIAGRGDKDVGTAGGAVAGAVVGSQLAAGHPAGGAAVTRCSAAPADQKPDHFDVTYHFNGVEHLVQTALPPGPTIQVNGSGEPRL